eukprot:6206506-Pleurochrysis_carterae.AAC.1
MNSLIDKKSFQFALPLGRLPEIDKPSGPGKYSVLSLHAGISVIVPHSLLPSKLSFAYGTRPNLNEWGEQSGYASNPVEAASHPPPLRCRGQSPSQALMCDLLI